MLVAIKSQYEQVPRTDSRIRLRAQCKEGMWRLMLWLKVYNFYAQDIFKVKLDSKCYELLRVGSCNCLVLYNFNKTVVHAG